jgi:hypothetical protein
MKPGDRVRCAVHEDWRTSGPAVFEGIVHFVDAEGRPLAVGGFEAIIEGMLGFCPLIWREGQAFTLRGSLVEVTPL